MSHGLSPSTSTVPDLTFLIVTLQEVTHALLSYSEHCEDAHAQQSLASQKPTQATLSSPSIPRNSKRAKRTAKCQACAFNRYAPDALNDFAGKELAKSFDEAYRNGNFRDEIRYYFVPSHVVKFEHRLLHTHQQNSALDMLLGVHTDLDIRSKLLAYLAEETNPQGSAQVSESLVQPLRLLQAIHSHLSNHTLIHKEMLRCPYKR